MKYDRVLIFTKKGNLMKYLCTDKVTRSFSNANAEGLRQYYGQDRDIQLIACLRWEDYPVSTRNGIMQIPKCFCKIKCPINPLPVRGEFEVASLEALRSFLKADGWTLKQDVCSNLFN